MAKRKNKVQAKANKKKFLDSLTQPLATKKNVQNSFLETGKDLLIGVVGGGFAGAAIGKPSLLVGIVVTGTGHFLENRLLTSLGMGMMASNGFQSKSLKGVEGLEGVKERLNTYKETFMEKTYLDKVKLGALKSLPKGNAKTTEGMGNVQYFTYPQRELEGANDELEMLNRIESHITGQGVQRSQISGLENIENPAEFGELNSTDFGELNDTAFDELNDLSIGELNEIIFGELENTENLIY